MTIKAYACSGSGNCFKAWLALQQPGLPFALAFVDVLAVEQRSPASLAINSLGAVPDMFTETGEGIGESNAMYWYLAEGRFLMPRNAAEGARALQWMFFEHSKLKPFISPARFFTTIMPSTKDERAADIANLQEKAKFGLDYLDHHLPNSEFTLISGYLLSDIAVFGYTHVIDEAGLLLKDYPGIARGKVSIESTLGFRCLSQMAPATMDLIG